MRQLFSLLRIKKEGPKEGPPDQRHLEKIVCSMELREKIELIVQPWRGMQKLMQAYTLNAKRDAFRFINSLFYLFPACCIGWA